MNRRELLRTAGAGLTLSLAGCTLTEPDPEVAEDPTPPWSRAGEVYHSGHSKGMKLIGTAEYGDRTVALSYTYVERFWTMTGARIQRVGAKSEYNAVHMMVSVWDTETETVLPVDSGLQLRVKRAGEPVTQRAPWPMLSQRMGFHFGDNILFPEQDRYTIEVNVGTTTIQRRGPFEGKFDESGTISFEFEFLRTIRNEIEVQKLLDRQGEPGAQSPMEMANLPLSVAPPADALPGRVLEETTSGDADIVVTATETGAGTYLAVSPRTPYNSYVLPLMSISVTVDRRGTTIFEGPLSSAIGPDRSYHYGETVENIEPGDELTVTVESPPQVARHEGYESAFLEMEPVTVVA